MDPNLQQEIVLAAFLIRLGLTTVAAVRDTWAKDGHDDETLDDILVKVDEHLALHQ